MDNCRSSDISVLGRTEFPDGARHLQSAVVVGSTSESPTPCSVGRERRFCEPLLQVTASSMTSQVGACGPPVQGGLLGGGGSPGRPRPLRRLGEAQGTQGPCLLQCRSRGLQRRSLQRVAEPSYEGSLTSQAEIFLKEEEEVFPEELEEAQAQLFVCPETGFLPTMFVFTEQFQVVGPRHPIVAVLGKKAILPCALVPAMNAENMELGWFRTTFSQPVLIYWNQREQTEEQMAEYRGRTSLVRDFLSEGQASMRIHKVQVFDNGMYTCFFRHGGFSEEADLELKVAGMGSDPQVHIEGPEEDGLRLVCKASGWFPKPQVQWRDLSGKKFPALSEAHSQDNEELFSVEATLVVRDSSVGNVTCSVLNPVLGQEKAMAIYIPEPFFPQASPWKPAFAVVLTMLGLLLLGACYFIRKEHSRKMQVRQEKEHLRRLKEEEQQAKEEALKSIGTDMWGPIPGKVVEARTLVPGHSLIWAAIFSLVHGDLGVMVTHAWRKAPLYADWRKEQFQAWPVTMDPDSAHHRLSVSHEKMRLFWKDPDVYHVKKCSVLGLEGITSGRWYWEVEIENELHSKWTLGVCRKDVRRKGNYLESSQRGFWVMGKGNNSYFARTDPETWLYPRQDLYRVGVFLDYSEGEVSFYNMIDGSHIFSFPPALFSGTLHPYFMLMYGDVSMTICSMESGSEGLPVSLNNFPPLEETLSTPMEGFSSGSGVDGAPPEAESLLLP
ncbi:butyrophilin subfamily 1 member A1-like [Callospermophilus lateralis]|uniref:butyrophilin subfamily 1 member A1-like n=1 Tax=Callospermophilus lateralis TaxID=76772 RepID=UPI0040389F8B